jgi:hypothetical protein
MQKPREYADALKERCCNENRMAGICDGMVSVRPSIKVGDKVRKAGGSYQATGTIKAVFQADDGSPRYVFRFDNPPGLLHIFSGNNLERITADED